jgi:hypothetical protein
MPAANASCEPGRATPTQGDKAKKSRPLVCFDTSSSRIESVNFLQVIYFLPVGDSNTTTPRFGFVAFAETWNGRLAMLGFVIGLGTELLTGQGILGQLGLG